MANECIPLALSKRNLAKLNFPVLASIKIDGVPVRLTVKVDIVGNVTSWEVVSRQGKPVESCSQLMLEFMQSARSIFEGVPGTHKIVGEIHSRENTFEDFKTVSGIVRRKYDQSHLLAWAIFDYYWDGTDEPYGERMKFIDQRLAACITPDSGVYVVPQITYFDEESLLQWFRRTTQAYPSMEGGIAMSYSASTKRACVTHSTRSF